MTKKNTNSNTEAAKIARAKTSKKYKDDVVAAGGWRLTVLYLPEAAEFLRSEMQRTNKSAASFLNEALLSMKQFRLWKDKQKE